MEYSNLGTVGTLKKIKLKDIRNYWRDFFLNTDCVLLIVSSMDKDKQIEAAVKYFETKKGLNKVDQEALTFKKSKKIIFEEKKLPQISCVLAFDVPNRTSINYYSIEVLRNLLLSGWISRLMYRLRVEESLIYGFSSLYYSHTDKGMLAFNLSTKNENIFKLLDIVAQEIKKLKSEKIRKGELDNIKGYLKGKVEMTLETSYSLMSWYGVTELLYPDIVQTPKEYISEIDAVSVNDIFNVINKYLINDKWYLSVVGDIDISKIEFEI